MAKTPMRPAYASPYPGASVTPSALLGPGLAPETLALPAASGTNNYENGDRRLLGNPTSGVVKWSDQWMAGNPNRKRAEVAANVLADSFRAIGWEGTVSTAHGSVGGSALRTNLGVPGHFINFLTGALSGDYYGLRCNDGANGLVLYKWVWRPTIRIFFQTNALTNCRIWMAASKEEMNAKQVPNGTSVAGGVTRAAGLRYDSSAANGNWWIVGWDGSVLSTDTGIAAIASKVYRFTMEVDNTTTSVRYYLYNWSDGIDHGLIGTHTWGSMPANQLFGIECLVEALAVAASPAVDIARVVVEHT